jgi:methionyl-tRNA synthetase
VNSDVVGKLVNIAGRCAGFITKYAGGTLSGALPDPDLYRAFSGAREAIAAAYEARDTAGAMREIMNLADRANQYIDAHKPWALAKQAAQADASPRVQAEIQGICTEGLNLFRVLMIYLQPVLPEMAVQAQRFFQEQAWTWDDVVEPLLGTSILPYQPLATRLDPKAVARLIDAETGAAEAAAPQPVRAAAAGAESGPDGKSPPARASDAAALAAAAAVEGNLISIDEFMRVVLRVARILSAELIPGADKLLKLQVDVGELGKREIFAGIRAAYDPGSLVGRLIVVVANLEPRKMRFGVSEGMMLAAGPGGKDIFALSPDSGAAPGMRVK